MSKIIDITYRGEIGYFVTVEQVRNFLLVNCSLEDFLSFKNKEGVTNSQIILDSYGVALKIKLGLADEEGNMTKNASDIKGEMPCLHPIVFYMDSDKVTSDLILNQSTLTINADFTQEDENGNLYASQDFFHDNFIKPIVDATPKNRYVGEDNERALVRPKVWIWCKSLCDNGVFNEYSVFDLTPFVQFINTNQTETGGNWSLKLLPIDGNIELKTGGDKTELSFWHPNKQRYIKFDYNSKSNFLFRKLIDYQGIVKNVKNTAGKDYYQSHALNQVKYAKIETDDDSIDFIHNEVFFKNLISENDVIFISFDSKPNSGIVLGQDKKSTDQVVNINKERVDRFKKTGSEEDRIDDFFLNCDEIYNNGWDMIGLVDSNSLQLNYENTDQDVNVSGRDLMKLLLEDGSYFFAKSYSSEATNSIFGNVNLDKSGDGNGTTNKRVEETNPKGVNRLITTGIIDMLYNPQSRNVQFVMNLLLSRLANIEVCPSEVFKSYGDEATQYLIPTIEYEDLDNAVKNNKEDGD